MVYLLSSACPYHQAEENCFVSFHFCNARLKIILCGIAVSHRGSSKLIRALQGPERMKRKTDEAKRGQKEANYSSNPCRLFLDLVAKHYDFLVAHRIGNSSKDCQMSASIQTYSSNSNAAVSWIHSK